MADPIQQLLNIFLSLVQPLPGDLTGQQTVLRGLNLEASPSMGIAQKVENLQAGVDFELVTTFTGPWKPTVIAVKFTVDDGGGTFVPNEDPKTVGLYAVIEGVEYPLIELHNWTGTAVTLTDSFKLGVGDQVRIFARCNTGRAQAVVRSEEL